MNSDRRSLLFTVAAISFLIISAVFILTQPTIYDVFTDEQLDRLNLINESVLVVTPVLTANAYAQNGFYDYFFGRCDVSCLTVEIDESIEFDFLSSKVSVELLERLDALMISDYDLAKNPELINHFDIVVLLHNEYVTRELFEAIQNHSNVIYLYPNALYAEVQLDGNSMTLIRGHGFPDSHISNGFDWKHDNSKLEYDLACLDYSWTVIDNGYQLNCYPENYFLERPQSLEIIKQLADDIEEYK